MDAPGTKEEYQFLINEQKQDGSLVSISCWKVTIDLRLHMGLHWHCSG
jgi:hypothetical protein